MRIKHLVAVATAAAAMSGALAGSASADDQLTCYDVGFDHAPSVYVVGTPPRVVVDDGDPYVRQYPC